MKLICINCGNDTYFEADVEGLKAIQPSDEGIIIDDADYDNWNYSDETLRANLMDIVDYVLKDSDNIIHYDSDTGCYYNSYIICARCRSRRVTIPYSEWRPPLPIQSVTNEIMTNRYEYLALRKERIHENYLPVLWQH
jgi:hypothetical protein